MEHVLQMSVQELKKILEQGEDLVIIDSRGQKEWDEFHIEGAVHIPAPDCRHRYQEVEKKRPVVILCKTTHRSSLAASILKQNGFTNVSVVTGGTTAWQAAGYSEKCPTCEAPHGPRW